jgi:HK97 family phage major capsid protein
MDAKKIIELKQERANITNSIRTLMNEFEGKEMEAIKKEELAKLEARFDGINDSIMIEERQLQRERALGEEQPKAKVKNQATEMFMKALSGDVEHMKSYQNSFTLGNDDQAGYLTAPVDFRDTVIRGLDNLLFIRQISNVVGPIGAAQSLGFPFRKTQAADATWVGEVNAAVEETTLDFGRREFKPNKMAKLIKLSRTLINHAPIAESAVQREILYSVGIGAENAYLNGNGTGQPLGIFTANSSGISTNRDVATGNTATAVTFDGLINAKYAVKQQYQRNASWVVHRDFAKNVAKIKDGEGNYIWFAGVVNGQPDRLLGAPVYMSEYAPNTFTTGQYVGVYGDFREGYWIADADALRVQVLKELYAVTNQVGYIVDYFGDGAPVLEEAFSRVKLG